MPLIEPIIRPPAEADSFLLQVTTGCSSDECTFCGAYKEKPFRVLEFDRIKADIEEGAKRFPEIRRVFLLDGDALVLNNSRMLPILKALEKNFPLLSRVAGYANGHNITGRTDDDLKELFHHKLGLIYIGLESGSQYILEKCRKRSSVEEMVQAVSRVQAAGIKASVIVLLGLGGQAHSREHVEGTIEALNKMQPRYLSFLSLMVIPGTPLDKDAREGTFKELKSRELLQEAHDIIRGLDLEKTVFRCNHASNFLPLEGRLPKDKDKLLEAFRMGIAGKRRLRPAFLRGL